MCKHDTLRLKHKRGGGGLGCGGLGGGLCSLDESINNSHSDQWVPVALSCGGLVLCTSLSWFFFLTPLPSVCQYCWLSISRGLISQHTLRPLMKVEESRGVSKHQRQQGASPHCACACTSGNWFSIAGTCPHHKTSDAFLNGTVKSA